MRILVVNDDGIRAPGIETLARAAAEFGEVYVLAPAGQNSCMSQRMTISAPMPLERVDFPVPVRAAWQLGGTPTDCVKAALGRVLDFRPDYVFSGVNNGWNAGHDIAYSGTVGACLEAVMQGVPAIAFSAPHQGSLTETERYLPQIAAELMALNREPGTVWNVNFPEGEPKGVLRDRFIAPMQLYQSVYTEIIRDGQCFLHESAGLIPKSAPPAGSDAAAIFDGYISIGRISCMVMR